MTAIWITGVGVDCALGRGQTAFWENLLSGNATTHDWRLSPRDERGVRVARMRFDADSDAAIDSGGAPDFVRAGHNAMAEAIAQAALCPDDLGPAGLVLGTTSGGMMDEFADACTGEAQSASAYHEWAGIGSTARWLRQRFGIGGPSSSVSAACTSSAAAIAQGMFLIQQGICELAIVGGCDRLRAADAAGFGVLRATAATTCRPFAKDRDGMLPADGAAFLVIESAQHARWRGASPLAEIVSAGFSCDAFHATSPHADGVAAAMRQALRLARKHPRNVGYVNCHGTGTVLNDKNEALAMKYVFGEHLRELFATSTKSATGHLLGTAGAIEAVVCVLVLQHQTIPPMRTVSELDPCVEFLAPTRAPYVWGAKQPLEYVMSNSLGFGGTNASLILRREVPQRH